MKGTQGSETPAEHPLAFLKSEEFQQKLLDDPKNVVEALERVINTFDATLVARDRAILAEIERRDPEIRSLQSKVEELRKNPELAKLGLSDAQLAGIAKQSLMTPKVEDEDDGFRGAPAGGRRVESNTDTAFEKEVKYHMEKMGYDRLGK
jgi:hypothetical protein